MDCLKVDKLTDNDKTAQIICKPGMAHIKPEYVRALDQTTSVTTEENNIVNSEPKAKKPKNRGMNRKRANGHIPNQNNGINGPKLCPYIKSSQKCPYEGKCRYEHNIDAAMCEKKVNMSGDCYNYRVKGFCPMGIMCLWSTSHVSDGGVNMVDEDVKKLYKPVSNSLSKELLSQLRKKTYDFGPSFRSLDDLGITYGAGKDRVMFKAGKKMEKGKGDEKDKINKIAMKVEDVFDVRSEVAAVSDERKDDLIIMENNDNLENGNCGDKDVAEEIGNHNMDCGNEIETLEFDKKGVFEANGIKIKLNNTCIIDNEAVSKDINYGQKILGEGTERHTKRIVNWIDQLYLAPLTTVGNLPFRRVCKEWGADITCGEMAMASKLVQGVQSEWALLKRHPTEDIFGVQICGAHPEVMTKCTQMIGESCRVDFIDINGGCPIDLVCDKGEGCGLLRNKKRLENIVAGMTSVIDCPITVKTRVGYNINERSSHILLPKLREAGADMIAIHGRTKEQRYTKQADWDYISQCVSAASPMPVYGNGDVLSYEDYVEHKNSSGVAGIMIGRGALIKPWLFTEIKEQRTWDISANERFDIIKKYVNYGLEYWGSDFRGVETTRKFLLEWMSFLHRYIPVGLLERLPQRINERPPLFFGRSDLETMMISDNCADWIKISEMILGPVPDSFQFVPKHRAHSY